MSNTICIIPSKDRALQLLCLLETLHSVCVDISSLDIIVVYKVSSEQFRLQYNEVKNRYPRIKFLEETIIDTNIKNSISDYQYVLFMVDDCVCVNSFSIQHIQTQLENQLDCIGFSLRLGKNIVYCYPFSCSQLQPKFVSIQNNILKFDWRTVQYDFGYPLELSSSMYRVKDIFHVWNDIACTVNHLEHLLWINSKDLRESNPMLLCFHQSCAFCNPLNVIASGSNKNRNSLRPEYSVNALADYFEQGLKIDVTQCFSNLTKAVHQEVD